MPTKEQCPCYSGETYSECCQPYHEGKLPPNALKLMRSRFAAYALNIPKYLIATTHPASPQYNPNHELWSKRIAEFSSITTFSNLEILGFIEQGSFAIVTFVAHLAQQDQTTIYTERSYFERIDGRWLYRNGQMADGRDPTLAPPDKIRLLPMAYYGNPILKRVADPIEEITDEIIQLVQDMKETMDSFEAIGIAAPQIHKSIRLFIIRQPVRDPEGVTEPHSIKVFINPELTLPSHKTCVVSEGCLSIPGVRSEVERPREITVEYTDLDGSRTTQRFFGWDARVIQHENDHIDGILFPSRLTDEKQKDLEAYLQGLQHRLEDK